MNNKTAIYNLFVLITILSLLAVFTSCNPSVVIEVAKDNSAVITLNIDIGATVESSLKSLMQLEDNANLFEEKDIRSSATKAGFQVKSLSFPTKTGVNLALKTNDIAKAFSTTEKVIKIEKNNLTLTISPQSLLQILNILPPEASEYLELLMAPIFTAEKLSAEEYIELIGAVYGKTLADEMSKSVLSITLIAPNKQKKVFTPKLAETLIITDKKDFTIQW